MNNKLTKKQFDIMTAIECDSEKMTQREISKITGISLGSVNRIITELNEQGLLKKCSITEKGLAVLEPYRVKRAIFIAAGLGSRLFPITINTPKPLVRVNGKRMIDTLLDAVVNTGIEEIYVVRGYLGEQFDQLLDKYPMIKFIENPLYNESNNISSAMYARHLLQNAYVLESDLLLSNPNLIRKYEYSSNFLGIPVKETDDWCLTTDKNGKIISEGVGGVNCYQMAGISYWSSEDGAKLYKDVKDVYNAPGGKERYWEQTALVYKKENYDVSIRTCEQDDIVEIDTVNELKAIDKIYAI